MVICSCDSKDFTSFGSRGVLNIHVNSGNWHTFSHCYTEPTDINLIIFTFVFETSGYQLVLARTTKSLSDPMFSYKLSEIIPMIDSTC